MFIETLDELTRVQDSLNRGDSLWIPIYTDRYKHYRNNSLCLIYIYSIVDDLEYILPIQHNDCLNLKIEQIQQLTSPHNIFVLAKKRFVNLFDKPCLDADLFCWWNSGKMLPLNETDTAAHDMWNRWYTQMYNSNVWLPVTKHLERCRNMRNIFMDVYDKFSITENYKDYDNTIINSLGMIESNGLYVDTKIIPNEMRHDVNEDNLLFTEYNVYTSTGRPSNKFGGINFSALNNDDGTRKTFISRNSRGSLVEFDYDAFHVRLIARLIGFDFPRNISGHTYLGQMYFNKQDLTDEEYNESKHITFRLIYGNIDAKYKHIPFIQATHTFIMNLWHEFKVNGYIETTIFHRRITKEQIQDPTPGKVFNYLLQAVETEYNILIISQINDLLRQYNTKLILYTYDAFLFDFDFNEGASLIKQLHSIITNESMPVKLHAGINYHDMRDMTSYLS